MAEFTPKARRIYHNLTDEEQEKALSILIGMNGIKTERAKVILDFCKESITTNAVVKI